ncbi:hypothetical protein [Neobacillus bataviensis]|uniref:hypothetical protein n=1 Tax=Neobacillus bataviensis TaxID=220685 RepID=UPI0011A3CAF5|nr:hypothetical protein [Neobacillus bataviensis]
MPITGKKEVVTVKIKRDCAHHGKAEVVTVKIKRNCAHQGKEEAVMVKIKRIVPIMVKQKP